jgi:Zn-dependent protease with chaperone function
MAVRVKLDRGPKGKPTLTLDDFRHPEDVRMHRKALIETLVIWVLMIGFVTLFGTFFGKDMKPRIYGILAAVVAGWVLLSAFYFLVIARRGERREEAELRKQQKRDAMANAAEMPAVKSMEEQARAAARALGAGVSGVLLTDDPPEARVVGGSIAFSRALQSQLTPEDIRSVIARQIGHLRAKHCGLLQLQRRVERLDPMVRYSLALPVAILAQRLASWTPYADRTADRAAMALLQNQKLCGSAIIKEAIAHYGGELEWRETEGWQQEEAGEQWAIDPEELSAYLAREGDLQLDAGDMTSHYRLGEFLRQHPDVRSRVGELARFAASPEYRAAAAKLKPAQ